MTLAGVWSPLLAPCADLPRALYVPPLLDCELLGIRVVLFLNLPQPQAWCPTNTRLQITALKMATIH